MRTDFITWRNCKKYTFGKFVFFETSVGQIASVTCEVVAEGSFKTVLSLCIVIYSGKMWLFVSLVRISNHQTNVFTLKTVSKQSWSFFVRFLFRGIIFRIIITTIEMKGYRWYLRWWSKKMPVLSLSRSFIVLFLHWIIALLSPVAWLGTVDFVWYFVEAGYCLERWWSCWTPC